MDSNSWETAVVWDLPQHKWFEEGGEKTRSFALSSNLVKQPPLLWFGPVMGVWCLFLQEPGTRGRTLCWLKTLSCVSWRASPGLGGHGTKFQALLLPNPGSFWRLKYVLMIRIMEIIISINSTDDWKEKNINQKRVRSLSASTQWNCCWVISQLQVDHGAVSDSNCTSLSNADFLRDA